MKEKYYVKQGESILLNDNEITTINKFILDHNISFETFDTKQRIFHIPRSYVGYINLPIRNIIIQPLNSDININHILRLYFFTYGFNSANLEDNIYDLGDSDDFEKITSVFIDELSGILRKGLPTSYIHICKSIPYMKGTINIIESYKNIYLKNKNPFVSTYDCLTKDININRILGAALNKISLIKNDPDINYLNKYFINVDINNYNTNEKIFLDRKNFYCKKALDFSYMILNELFYNNFSTESYGESFIINYDRLFEDFIKKILIMYTNDSNFTFWNSKEKYGDYSLGDSSLTKEYIPDILYNYQYDKTPPISYSVIDVKNKTSSIFKNQDVYQMIFYSLMLNSNKSILCYPSVGYTNPTKLTIDGALLNNKSINAVFINITPDSKSDFILSINKFINDIYSIL